MSLTYNLLTCKTFLCSIYHFFFNTLSSIKLTIFLCLYSLKLITIYSWQPWKNMGRISTLTITVFPLRKHCCSMGQSHKL